MSTKLAALWLFPVLAATPPEDGLNQQFNVGDQFLEDLKMTVMTPAGGEGTHSVKSKYSIQLATVTESVESSVEAKLRSTVVRVTADINVGDVPEEVRVTDPDKLKVKYDSSEQQTRGSVDASTFDADTLAEIWSPFRGVSIERTATTDGSLVHDRTLGLPIASRGQPMAQAFEQAVSTLLSWPLPAGPVDRWTDETDWPTAGGAVRVLRLCSYEGRNEGGLDQIRLSMASTGPDGAEREAKPELVAKGLLLFDPQLGRIVSLDLIVDRKASVPTRTDIVWRLQYVPPAIESDDSIPQPPAPGAASN